MKWANQQKNTTNAPGEPDEAENSQGTQTSQPSRAASNPRAPLMRADMEAMLRGLEERIISKLSAQSSVDWALLEQHDTTIQQLETSLELETTCNKLMIDNEMLRLKADDLENRSRLNNICITGLPEKIKGSQPTAFLTKCRELCTSVWLESIISRTKS
ncbi:hypothetical protein ATANTOWER_007023 [Ataeniobius toweri]|uniref:Uncharacterized protein n=1 Tax=Ataeniobius toweri TaxID=208326 RepID=A0ABU7BXG5_9TELE|nr:hypothetical protein [Ataeniobius toweri]